MVRAFGPVPWFLVVIGVRVMGRDDEFMFCNVKLDLNMENNCVWSATANEAPSLKPGTVPGCFQECYESSTIHTDPVFGGFKIVMTPTGERWKTCDIPGSNLSFACVPLAVTCAWSLFDTFPNSCTTVTLFDANLIWGKGEKPMGHAFLAFFSYSNYYKDDKGETGSQRTLDVRVMLRSISAGKENAMCSGSFQVQNGSCFGINTGSNRYNAEATEPLPAPTLDGEPPWPIPDYIKTPSKADQLGPLWIALCVLLICARCACRFYFRRRRAADAARLQQSI
ncbi:unnamed protein product [Durusdinium trenchii]|uniref:Uncharacterized protein n=1 Tax=Durusdinium trenchii TaxID=1381693 RepID=A0ABP0I4K0_9DINO